MIYACIAKQVTSTTAVVKFSIDKQYAHVIKCNTFEGRDTYPFLLPAAHQDTRIVGGLEGLHLGLQEQRLHEGKGTCVCL